jgi:hypothetical protein
VVLPQKVVRWQGLVGNPAKGYKFNVAAVDTDGALGTQSFAQLGLPSCRTGRISGAPHDQGFSPSSVKPVISVLSAKYHHVISHNRLPMMYRQSRQTL